MKLRYEEYKPGGFISQFVECFWLYENKSKKTKHTILPHGYFEIVAEFSKGELFNITQSGVWTQPVNVVVPTGNLVMAIRFKLSAAEYLFQHPINDIRDLKIPLPHDFWTIEQYGYSSFRRFVKAMSARIWNQLINFPLESIDERKLKLFKLIYQRRFQSVDEIAQQIGWSTRHINRYFNQNFGFPLKEYLKILRCSSAYKHISQGELSAPPNYFDQSHFIKDIKHYTGTTPRRLYENKDERFLQLIPPECPLC